MPSNRLLIAAAMMWKYGVKCAKNAAGDDIEIWESETIPKPNRIQIARDLEEYEAFLAATAYKEKRSAEYPSVGDQLDAIWKGGADMELMRQTILAVKAKYPNPAEVVK